MLGAQAAVCACDRVANARKTNGVIILICMEMNGSGIKHDNYKSKIKNGNPEE
jgi:hypothetical protein